MKIVMILCFTLYELIYSASKNPLDFNYFFLSNNITGTNDPTQLDDYRDRCIQKFSKCNCCVGDLDNMRCGLPVICIALIEGDIQRRQLTAENIGYYIIIIYAGGIQALGLAFKLSNDRKYYIFVIILVTIGLITTFPFSLCFIYFMCKRKKSLTFYNTNIKAKPPVIKYNINPQINDIKNTHHQKNQINTIVAFILT